LPENQTTAVGSGLLAVTFLLLLMTTMAVTGLVRAGTDIYFPPFGGWAQDYIAADQVPPSSLERASPGRH